MNTVKHLVLAIAVGGASAFAVALPAAAQAQAAAPASATEPAEMSDATVRKVDKAQGKVTLKHGEIKHLDMPAMTMVFAVKDKALLDKVREGDKVKFKAVSDGGKLTVVALTVAP